MSVPKMTITPALCRWTRETRVRILGRAVIPAGPADPGGDHLYRHQGRTGDQLGILIRNARERNESRWNPAGHPWDRSTSLSERPSSRCRWASPPPSTCQNTPPITAWTRAIRIAIINLAGIPSVVYGLFGLGLFVIFLKFGTSILAASLTLSIMTLPVIISTTEEALRAVPHVLPSGEHLAWRHPLANHPAHRPAPGLSGHPDRRDPGAGARCRRDGADPVHRRRLLPAASARSPLDPTMALPYHLFVISTQVPGMPIQIQYGTVLVLLVFVLGMNLIATVIRSRARARRQW